MECRVYWIIILISGTCIVEASEELLNFELCNYMLCKMDNVSTVVVQYDQRLWAKHNPVTGDFDLSRWNWSELDLFAQRDISFVEITFNELNLSKIEKLDGHDSVISINLENNDITTIANVAFGLFGNLQKLVLRNNVITGVDHAYFYKYNNLQHLDLSSNRIVAIKGFTEPDAWTRLKHLNLSHNRIEWITDQLYNLTMLEVLDLSNNNIYNVCCLNNNLQRLLLDHNQQTDWPLDKVPAKLHDLSMCCNGISYTGPASGVRKLDLSYNRLTDFCSKCFPYVEELNLSGNYFNTVPDWSIPGNTSLLTKLCFNSMPYLQIVNNNSFQKTVNLKEIEISTCPQLTNIEENTFTALAALERLDLSYNGLQQVHENIVRWNRIKHGVNLQGNPFRCDCSMQWVLDKVIKSILPHRELHALLPDLRCTQPSNYKNQLMVRLTLHDNELCRTTRQINAPIPPIINTDENHFMEKIILCCLAVAIIITIIYLVYLKTKPRTKFIPIYR